MDQPISCYESLDNYQKLYRLLIHDLAEYAVFLVDTTGCIATWNKGVEQILQYSEAGFVGRPFDILFTPEDRALGIPKRELVTAQHEGVALDERWHLRRDGSRFFCEGILRAVRSDTGQLLGFSKVMRDATKRKQAEDERDRLLGRLKQSNEDLSRFAHVISHDLQAPVRMVRGYAELLFRRYKGQLDEAADDFLGYLIEGCKGMESLIRGLLRYSQATDDSGTRTSVPMQWALEGAILHLQREIEESGAEVTYDALPTITGYPTQLVQVFQNLLANAIRYKRASENPRIHIAAVEQAQHWLFAVSDNGMGIGPEHHEQIFQPLKRLYHSDIPGTGIGLATCRRVIEHHGGRIWVESELGAGAKFYFTLPK